MPLQNRVTPFGELIAVPARGTLFGNRGGRFHADAKTLTARRWASRQWICCVLDFKGRQRDVWGRFYTELFFLDAPTALAVGPSVCIGAISMRCPTVLSSRSARRLSRYAAIAFCVGRRKATTPEIRGRAAGGSTCSRRRLSLRCCRPATIRAGPRALPARANPLCRRCVRQPGVRQPATCAPSVHR